jgi:hypothetical protein
MPAVPPGGLGNNLREETMKSTSTTATRKKTAAAARAAKPAASERPSPTHEEIALRAQELYRQSGCQVGRDREFWLEAERQLQCGLRT